MENKFEHLNLFFEKIKNLTFLQRIFFWKKLKNLSYDAYEEFKSLLNEVIKQTEKSSQAINDIALLKNDNVHLTSLNQTFQNELNRLNEKINEASTKNSDLVTQLATKDETLKQVRLNLKDYEIDVATKDEKITQLTNDNSLLKQENIVFKQQENERKVKYESDVASLNLIREQIQNDRKKEIDEKHKEEIERFEKLKETWAKHQDDVKETIKSICQKHTIEYIEKVPFKGSPDNTLRISDEFIVFDAKSPASDDLSNFSTYIKTQTEAVKKYAKEENVKKDIFLVVPSNTVEVIRQFSFNMADYKVFIVTIDALEPIILCLQKIEEYEFIEQLSPEERDNVCRVIGKFAHMTKRRIQIDQFFERQFLEILTKCESDLPRDILEKVIDFERSEKLNPPQEKRAKLISNKELEADSNKIRKEAEAKSIIFPASIQRDIKELPLYSDESATPEKP